MSDRWSKIYAAVRGIPKGRVASYGQVAEAAGKVASAAKPS